MKKLLFILLTLFTLSTSAQDGLARWIDTDSVDVFISTYNSPVDTRVEIADIFFEEATQNSLRAKTFTILLDSAMIVGETFIVISETYILFDVYVDEVKYLDGRSYKASRHQKPTGPIDYNKF
jgi:hypothetical protein